MCPFSAFSIASLLAISRDGAGGSLSLNFLPLRQVQTSSTKFISRSKVVIATKYKDINGAMLLISSAICAPSDGVAIVVLSMLVVSTSIPVVVVPLSMVVSMVSGCNANIDGFSCSLVVSSSGCGCVVGINGFSCSFIVGISGCSTTFISRQWLY